MKTANKTRAALENRALLAARELIDRMRALYRELEQLTGAPIGLHRALVCIGNEPGLQASVLAVRLGMQRPAVSQVLKSLTMRGWIERRRSDADQRAIQIHATTAGRAVFTLQRAVCQLPQPDLEKFASSVELLLGLLPEAGTTHAHSSALRTARRRSASIQRRA